MKAFILAAGLGTRLRPFTLTNPKALVPVGGVPMLKRVVTRLIEEGFDDIVINVHHFADKIVEYIEANESFGVRIRFSDERDCLLDTGGAVLHAMPMLGESDEPFLIHNVDILSDAPLGTLMRRHQESGADATLLVSGRDSSRRLIFDSERGLRGWQNVREGIYKPSGFEMHEDYRALAFSGIHIMSPVAVAAEMARQGRSGVFSVIDFYLEASRQMKIKGEEMSGLRILDIGKPATLSQADNLLLSDKLFQNFH